MRKLPFIVALLGILDVGPTYAWGDMGHKTVGEIAMAKVKPSTHAARIKLINADGEFESFSNAWLSSSEGHPATFFLG